mmetsp:Transcript_27037/g.58989  ORF Transcript_27037/g.58989 Transcript_27037/m.58989 type:complete len:272 (+) Transcript_27037:252-1067(+)|eukprot:CAMPEP_0118936230 /NCGR_PEP_ID=MMETSP1169-20130426/17448_1 /TAXON_ID=36882 /ORGANISM="Pyramimonas obovata, Strain CCMP722" /LENGTH=271 /DNA_ID=CAMNT_0006879399 /DNA_START=196 /DNA_END=1011 /DNA_ORIENTATION=+
MRKVLGLIFLLTFRSGSHISNARPDRTEVQKLYNDIIASGFIGTSYGLVFLPRVMDYYDKAYTYLDAGCGQCGVVSFLMSHNKSGWGVEVSEAAVTTSPSCIYLVGAGRVKHSSLTAIPYPDNYFDLVFSSDVLEHIPEVDIPEVLAELARVSKGDIFLSISLRRAGGGPPAPAPAVIHVTVKPRAWWDKMFAQVGCAINRRSIDAVLAGRSMQIEPWLFSYRCKNLSVIEGPIKTLFQDPLWSSGVQMKRMTRPSRLRQRLAHTKYRIIR